MEINHSLNYYLRKGFLYGLGATVLMTLVMFTGMKTGVSPIPEPIPVALAKLVFGALSKPVLMIIALLLHFIYGSVNGAIAAGIFKSRATFWHGIGWGILLWIIMQLIVLPILGWGIFGTAVTFKIAFATLILHLVYGSILGWGFSRP